MRTSKVSKDFRNSHSIADACAWLIAKISFVFAFSSNPESCHASSKRQKKLDKCNQVKININSIVIPDNTKCKGKLRTLDDARIALKDAIVLGS